jgi:hypothetical protein
MGRVRFWLKGGSGKISACRDRLERAARDTIRLKDHTRRLAFRSQSFVGLWQPDRTRHRDACLSTDRLRANGSNTEYPKSEDLPAVSPVVQSYIGERLEPLLGRLEETVEDAFALFGLSAPAGLPQPGFSDRSADEALVYRVERLLEHQLKLNSALQALVHEAGRTLEPRVLEARVDAGRMNPAWGRDRRYWQAYRAQFDKNGKTLSILELLRDAMAQASGRTADAAPGIGKEEGIPHEE